MRTTLRLLTLAGTAAVALAATGCASDTDRLAAIETRLGAMESRIAEIDERTRPRFWVPTVTVPSQHRWMHTATEGPNWRFVVAPDSWWPILESGGCVLPRGTRPVRIVDLRILPDSEESPAEPGQPEEIVRPVVPR